MISPLSPAGRGAVLFVDDAHLDIGARDSGRAQALAVARVVSVFVIGPRERGNRHRALALSVDLGELGAEGRESAFHVGDVHGTAAIDDEVQVGGVGAGERRAVEQPHHHRRRREHAESGVLLDQVENLRRLEAAALGNHVVGALGDEGQRVEARAVGERRCVQHAIVGRDRVEIGEVAQCHHHQVAVSDGGALGPARGAAGVEEPGGIVGPGRGGAFRVVAEHGAPVVRARDERRSKARHLVPHAFDPLSVAFVGDAEPGPRIAQDVGDLAGVQLGVDRDRDEPCVPDAEQRLQVVRPVRHDDGDPRARGQPVHRAQRARDCPGAPVERAVVGGDLVAERDRRPLG